MRGKKTKPAKKAPRRARGRVSDRPRRKSSNDGKLARALADAAEARAHQAATAEILRVISESPTDVQPVFDAIAKSASRLFGTWYAGVLIREGDMIHNRAMGGLDPKSVAKVKKMFPMPFDPSSILAARAILDGRFIEIPDTESVEVPSRAQNLARAGGWRAVAFMPLLRGGRGIGAIAMANRDPSSRFTKHQVSLLRTFAKQAVIAIENVRAFHETREALAEQKASGEVLAAIAGSMSDTAPVFDRILEACERLFAGYYAGINVIGEDGLVHLAAFRGPNRDAFARVFPFPNSPDSATGIAIATGKVVHVPDTEAPGVPAVTRAAGRAGGVRASINAPLIADEGGIGSIYVARQLAGPFTEREIARLEVFANQATIAIKNARLFNETKEALERQTATAEILGVIANSPADIQPVFDAIAQSAIRLIGGHSCSVTRVLDDRLHIASLTSTDPSADDLVRSNYPMPLTEQTPITEAARSGRTLLVSDTETDSRFDGIGRQVARSRGFRTIAYVPMRRQQAVLGVIHVARAEPSSITDQHVSLLESFADQAVIAIQNARLFNETKEALERQTATAEILRVISRSPTDIQPVLDAVAESAARLCEAADCSIFRLDDDRLVLAAHHGPITAPRPIGEFSIFLRRESVAGRTVLDARTVHVADLHAAADEYPSTFEATRSMGFRTMLNVPLIREGVAIGVIQLPRTEVRPFTDRQIALLETFADQAVIAIENVRLFNELEARNREASEALERQTATAEILKIISESPTDTRPVFYGICRSAARLFGCNVGITLVKGDQIDMAAMARPDGPAEWSDFDGIAVAASSTRTDAELSEIRKAIRAYYPQPLDPERSLVARAIEAREILVFPDTEAADVPKQVREISRAIGFRAFTLVPLLREGSGIGAISLSSAKPGKVLDDKQRALVQTFADQAVIAIENVRLFNETKEALERQTATAEILQVISSSPTNVQPVFDAIARNAARLLAPASIGLSILEGDVLTLGSVVGPATRDGQDWLEILGSFYPIPFDPAVSMAARAIVDGSIVEIPDIEAEGTPRRLQELLRAGGLRSSTQIPLIREGKGIGSIGVAHPQPGFRLSDKQLSLMKAFADQAVIAIENVRLFNETKEALERQTATAEILKVIASSPDDVQPVFDAIANSAHRLLGGAEAGLALIRGDSIELVAAAGLEDKRLGALRASFPRPLDLDSSVNRTAVHGEMIHYPDCMASNVPAYTRDVSRQAGVAAMLGVPLLREGRSIGGVIISRTTPGAFGDKQIELLRTFADQAVIAIENVRLFNETKEALERQTATAEILRVIGGAMTDTQPVFDAIVGSASRLFGRKARIRLVEGEQLRLCARSDAASTQEATELFLPIDPESLLGKVILGGKALQVHDAWAVDTQPLVQESARRVGYRSMAIAPLMREGRSIGGIGVHSREPGSLTDKEMALLQTFADQAVIAIENVRLFNETKEALERQTATAEILKVISQSPTDTQPVFDAIVQSAAQLFHCDAAILMREGESIQLEASTARWIPGSSMAEVRKLFPVPFDTENNLASRAMSTGRILEIPDTEAPDAPPVSRETGRRAKIRSMTHVPLIRDGIGIGSIGMTRVDPGFMLNDRQRALAQTFADQAVIAIENVRLFKELNERTDALTKSVGQLTALGEVGQAISSTLDLEKVLPTIVSRAVQLSGLDNGAIYEYDDVEEIFRLRAGENVRPEILELDRSEPIRIGEGAIGRAAATRQTVQIPDIATSGTRQTRGRDVLLKIGARALLAVPLVREDHVLGALAVIRNTPGEFPPEVVRLLETFATQSAIAIQNARLFREIEEKGRELEIASQHKSQFLASMSHELRTPLNAILGFNEMMLDGLCGEVPEGFTDPLQETQASGKHLLRLINNVLDLAKIEAGRMELALADYAVQDMVESVRSTLRPLAEAKGLAFDVAVPAELPLAHGDAGRLTQCLMNLAGNSLKFTKEGHVAISVEPKGDRLVFRVTDTGIGIPPDKIDTLFTEFKQTDATIANEYGGTGLGLSITKKFIEMHGGSIRVESEPGRGSTFIFEIPLRADAR